MSAPNLNALWSQVLLDALYQSGVRDVCITPGSRSTPLTTAVHRHEGLRAFVHIDERASAFFALGLAKATGRAVALVCTSGTAGANYFPAVIEAAQFDVPLIVLTADRPLGLRGTGAPQTIDQVRLFGPYVRHHAETPLPEATLGALRRLAAGAAQAVAEATGFSAGPVHLNIPFADPLAPIPTDHLELPALEAANPSVTMARASLRADERMLQIVASRLLAAERGLIVAGPAAVTTEADQVLELARRTGFPVLADAGSGLRYRPDPARVRCSYADAFLRGKAWTDAPADFVIRLGALPTSATLNQFLTQSAPWTVSLQSDLQRRDPEALNHVTLQGSLDDTLARLMALLPATARQTAWLDRFQTAERTAKQVIAEATEPLEALSVRQAFKAMPQGSAVFLSNSMPIRYAEAFCGEGQHLRVFVSRGANGIDGITSTALGIAAGTERPTLLVTGDLAFLHDLGGLLGARHLRSPFLALVLNNDGGGIFSHLPISGFPDVFEPYFGTPHGLTFSHASAMFGFDHAVADSCEAIGVAIAAGLESGRPTVIEVPTERTVEHAAYKRVMQRVADTVDLGLRRTEALR